MTYHAHGVWKGVLFRIIPPLWYGGIYEKARTRRAISKYLLDILYLVVARSQLINSQGNQAFVVATVARILAA